MINRKEQLCMRNSVTSLHPLLRCQPWESLHHFPHHRSRWRRWLHLSSDWQKFYHHSSWDHKDCQAWALCFTTEGDVGRAPSSTRAAVKTRKIARFATCVCVVRRRNGCGHNAVLSARLNMAAMSTRLWKARRMISLSSDMGKHVGRRSVVCRKASKATSSSTRNSLPGG